MAGAGGVTGKASVAWRAPAKINLTLRVRGRVANGYHALESLVAFADFGDRLDITRAQETAPMRFAIDGPMAEQLDEASQGRDNSPFDVTDNLVVRAANALAAYSGRSLPVDILLDKHIPVAAGLGGGSADAAACLRAMASLFNLPLQPEDMATLAAGLGADVPVCLSAQPAFMTDIGTQISRLPDLPLLDIVLVNPRRSLATGEVFAALAAGSTLKPASPPPEGFADSTALCRYLAHIGNDLHDAACGLVPEIGQCLETLARLDVLYAAMSGSGASCFALVPQGAGSACADAYRNMQDGHWCVSGRLLSGADDADMEVRQNA